uniref:hypothetical protein n=1 Tax=Ningiella ruwaisensis TaxID=2364274 RepID=UPI001F4F76AF|nr:hypothetical protein [Ningiella ruwaisensis]
MKPNMILKQNIPYAALIYSALDVCELMLARSSTLYPFAVVSIENDIQCVFTDTKDEHAQSGMIEVLEERLAEHRIIAENAISVLVYAATITTQKATESEAIVFNITDSNGENTVTLYPYIQQKNTIRLGTPFTCNF